jgi:hypothetical protein
MDIELHFQLGWSMQQLHKVPTLTCLQVTHPTTYNAAALRNAFKYYILKLAACLGRSINLLRPRK